MADTLPDRIAVHATYEEDLAADRVAIELVVESSSFISGHAALKRAEEVREVVALLLEDGVADDDIVLRDVVAETQQGVFTDRSSASYTLRATCRDLDRVADVLAHATRPKHTKLQSLTWRYPNDPALEDRWLRQAAQRANAKAQVLADGLGVRVLGVFEATSETIGDGPEARVAFAAAGGAARARSPSDTLAMPIAHTKRAGARVRVQYRVSGRE